MLVTAKMLRDLGALNVISINDPAIIINSGIAIAKTITYDSLEEIRLSHWFQDSKATGIIMVYDSGELEGDKYVVRLFDFSKWKVQLI